MMMLKVIARTVGLHHLILLSFYPYLQKYVQVPYFLLFLHDDELYIFCLSYV